MGDERQPSARAAGARSAIVAATATHVSVDSIWELTIKSMLGRLDLPDHFSAEELRAFPELTRHDPFDRLIVAQAASSSLRHSWNA